MLWVCVVWRSIHILPPKVGFVAFDWSRSRKQSWPALSPPWITSIASVIILQKSTHVSLSQMQKSPQTSPPMPHWLQTAKGQLETSLEWEIWNKLPRSPGIFSSSIKHTFSNRIAIISNADMTKLSWISQTLWQRRRSWRPGPAEITPVRFLGFWLLKFFPYCWLCSILSLFTTSPVGVDHLQGPYCLT